MAGESPSADTHPVLSQRVAGTLLGAKESWTRRMFELAAKMRADGGGPVHDLSLGNPSLEPPGRWIQAITELLAEEGPGLHRYMTNAGFPEVRAFIAGREAERWNLPFEAGHVIMTVGAAGALNVLLRSMVDPGEEVVVPAPYFSEYEHYCANVGARLRPVPTTGAFGLDPATIKGALGPQTRIVLLNSPNNPTGAIYSTNELEATAAVIRRANEGRARPIHVLEDSPYRDLVYDGSIPASMLGLFDNTIHLTSHSKDLGLAGERIGYIAISPRCGGGDLIARAAAFNNRILGFVNAPALMQRALPRVLGRTDGKVDVEVYARRARTMATALNDLGFCVAEPRAGFFLFPRLPERLLAQGDDADVILTNRLQEHRTIVVPGTAFGVPGHLRLSMVVSDESVDGAVAAFKAVCRS